MGVILFCGRKIMNKEGFCGRITYRAIIVLKDTGLSFLHLKQICLQICTISNRKLSLGS